jgi:uncharacterized protein (DUF433 family)
MDPRLARGLLSLAQAGRYLRIARQTFHRWARGYERGRPLLHVRDTGDDGLPVTFVSLTEAHVLDGLREAGVQPHKIRPALDALKRQFGHEYVLLAPELATDGVEVLWDFSRRGEGRDLIVGDTGQHIIREIVEDNLSYIHREPGGTPDVLELRHWQPSKVIVDVRRSFGQPIFAASGVRVADVAGMLRAGEDPDTVADEFGIGANDIRTAARILLGRVT